MTYEVQVRQYQTVNTDPQRRCYNGAHFSSAEVLTPWTPVCRYSDEADAKAAAATFKGINPTRQYRVVAVQP